MNDEERGDTYAYRVLDRDLKLIDDDVTIDPLNLSDDKDCYAEVFGYTSAAYTAGIKRGRKLEREKHYARQPKA